jgi:hypothetical protein
MYSITIATAWKRVPICSVHLPCRKGSIARAQSVVIVRQFKAQ